jgi:hypothetical protein
MTAFYLPAALAGLMCLRRTAWSPTPLRPFAAGYGRLKVSKFSTVIALVGSQASRTLLGTPLRLGHSYLVHHLQPYCYLSHIGRCHQKNRGRPWPSVNGRCYLCLSSHRRYPHPLFGCHQAPIQQGLVPVQFSLSVQITEEC